MYHSRHMSEGRDVGSYRVELSSGNVNVLCRFEREERAPVSELMSAGQMSRGFSTELSYPRAQQNVQSHPFADVCIHAPVYKLIELPCLRTSCINRSLSKGNGIEWMVDRRLWLEIVSGDGQSRRMCVCI